MAIFRGIRLFLLVTFLTLATGLPSFASKNLQPSPTSSHNFRTIPGITQEEILTIEAIQKEGRTLTYGGLYTSELFLRDDGSLDGFAVLFCDWLTDLFDIPFEPKIYD